LPQAPVEEEEPEDVPSLEDDDEELAASLARVRRIRASKPAIKVRG
jgi:hypothetical protein